MHCKQFIGHAVSQNVVSWGLGADPVGGPEKPVPPAVGPLIKLEPDYKVAMQMIFLFVAKADEE